jgi:hypothetical protein
MCDFSGRLIAWSDRELPEMEAADVERHVHTCAECQGRLHAYQKVSRTFDAYCDAAVASQIRPKGSNWLPAAPALEIAIPAEAMFPPGAVPEGVSFTADLTIGADGSAQRVRLLP